MPRGYLDEMIPVNSGILGQYISPVGPFREPMYAMVNNDTVAATSTRTRSSKSKKKKSNKPKNDGIIRNHDSVWDYKIQDGKLLTRRKSSDGKWYDITNNDEARSEIESFTGRTISGSSSKQGSNNQSAVSQSTRQSQVTQPTQPARQTATRQTTNAQSTPATTVQPARQQTVARQDSTRRDTTRVQQPVQQRSLAETPANNAEPDWQNTTDAEVAAYFANSPLGGVTKTAKGNPNKKNQLLSQEDLDANGWRWSDVAPGKNNDVTSALFKSAERKTQDGDKILLDSNGRIVPTSEVHRYVNRGRIPLYISDYDAQFYQPQAYNNIEKDIRRAEDRRRNREFDRQRNQMLGAVAGAIGLPILASTAVAAPLATGLSLGVGEGVNQIAALSGFDWDKWAGGDDPNAQFYAPLVNPFRAAGGIFGGALGNALQPTISNTVNPYLNQARQYVSNRYANVVNSLRHPINANTRAYPALAATEETEQSLALANAMEEALNPPGTPAQLAKAMNRSLKDKSLINRERQMLAGDVPALFDPEMTSSGYYYPLNPAMPVQPIGPYGIPNHVNGVPFGVPVPRVLGAVPESGTTLALPVRPGNSLQPMPDAFGYYGAPYQRIVVPRSVQEAVAPKPQVKAATKKQYPKAKGNKKKKK